MGGGGEGEGWGRREGGGGKGWDCIFDHCFLYGGNYWKTIFVSEFLTQVFCSLRLAFLFHPLLFGASEVTVIPIFNPSSC